MKRRLLAILLSIAMLMGSVPVYAAETGGGTPAANEEEASGEEASVAEAATTEVAAEAASPDTQEDANTDNSGNQESADADKSGNQEEMGAAESAPAKESGSLNPEPSASETTADEPESKPESGERLDTETDESTAESEENTDSATEESVEFESESEEEADSDEALAAADEISVLTLGDNAEITLARGASVVYSFTAESAGYYRFKNVYSNAGYNDVTIGLCDNENAESSRSRNDSVQSDYMAAGSRIYVRVKSISGNAAKINVTRLDAYIAAKTDSTYKFEADAYTLELTPTVIGYKTFVFDAVLRAKEGFTNKMEVALVAYYRPKGSAQGFKEQPLGSKFTLTSNNIQNPFTQKDLQINADIASGTEYDFYFAIKDDIYDGKKDTLAVFDAGNGKNISLTTKAWPQGTPADVKAILYNMQTTMSSVTFEIEFFASIAKCKYVLPDVPDSEWREMSNGQFNNASKGWHKYTFKNASDQRFKQGEKYRFGFFESSNTSSDDTPDFEFEATMQSVPADFKVEYSVDYANPTDKLNVIPTLTAKISGYKGDATRANISCSFKDTFGRTIEVKDSKELTDSGDAKTATLSVRICDTPILLKGETYTFTTQIEIIYGAGTDWITNLEHEETYTIPNDDTVGLAAGAPLGITIPDGRQPDGTIQAAIQTYDDRTQLGSLVIGIHRRHAGSKQYDEFKWTTSSSSANQHSSSADKGMAYEYFFIAGGYKKEISVAAGQTDVTYEMLESENNPFDIVRTFQAKKSDGGASSWSPKGLYIWDGSGYKIKGDYSVNMNIENLGSENSYNCRVRLIDIIEPDTDYSFKWEMADGRYIYENVHTPPTTLKMTAEQDGYNGVKLAIESDPKEFKNFTDNDANFGEYIIFHTSRRKRGEKTYTILDSSIYFDAGRYSKTGSWGVEPGETYEITLFAEVRTSYVSNFKIKTLTYTAPPDPRRITESKSPTVLGNSATIHVSFSGNGLQEKVSISGSYNKKGETSKKYLQTKDSSKIADNLDFQIEDLEPETTYEYSIESSSIRNQKLTGEFTTLSDGRRIAASHSNVTGATAKISYTLSGNPGLSTRVYYPYYREKGSGEWKSSYKEYSGYNYDLTAVAKKEYSVVLEGLKPKTTYEYAVIIWDDDSSSYVSSPDDVTQEGQKASGEFTTLADARKLTASPGAITQNSAQINYSMSGNTGIDTYFTFYYKEKGGYSWSHVESTDEAVTAEAHSGSFTLRNVNILPGEIYEYAIVMHDTRYGSEFPEKTDVSRKALGEFSRPVDLGDMNASADAYSTRARVRVNASGLNGAVFADGIYVHIFYREQGGRWLKAGTIEERNVSGFSSWVDISDLECGKTYDWAAVLSNKPVMESPDDSEGGIKQAGAFTTKTLTCTLSFTPVADSTTYNSTAYTIKAIPSDADYIEYLTVDLSLDKGDEYKNIRLSRNSGSSSFSAKKTLDGLGSETAYKITGATVRMYEYNSADAVAVVNLSVEGVEFTTRKLDSLPASVTLSKTQLKLNAFYDGEAGTAPNGYSREKLSLSVAPAEAPADVYWTSSDASVASVSADGTVTAKGAGTATITAASKHASNVKAECKVTVAAYAAGYKADGASALSRALSCTVTKGGKLEGIDLYDWAQANAPNAISEYEVLSDNVNIAKFDKDAKTLEGIGIGSAYITFEAGGYTARLKVNVTPTAKGFGVASVSNSSYPAVKNADGIYILAYKPADSKDQSDGTYKVNLEIAPKGSGTVNEGDFTWTSDKTDVASVSGQGVITPLNPGDVTLTIKRKDESYENVNEAKVKLSIKAMPDMDGSKDTISVLTNPELNIKKLSDVEFPAGWEEGWQWKEPDAPLVTNGADANASHKFEAFYADGGKYPMKAVLTVKIGKVTGVRIEADNTGNEAGLHNHVLKTEKDELALSVMAAAQGSVSASDYTTGIPDVDGLAITSAGNNTYKIKADRPGSYTLTPSIYAAGTDKVLAKAAYKITAVSDKVAASVSLSADMDGVNIISNGMISFDDAAKTDFNLTAEALDRDDQKIDPYSFVWKTTDKSVAKITLPERGKSGRAKIEIKGSGHAVLTAVASDKRQASASIRLEVKDHAPRVDTGRANVNIAYDYSENDGRMLAAEAGGAVEIVPVYAGDIESVELREEGSETPSDRLEAQYNGGYSYIIQPTAAALAEGSADKLGKGTYKCRLLVTTRGSQKPYEYGLTVKVTDSKPKVTAKMGAAPNLFYTYTTGTISLSISGKERLNSTVRWTDNDAQNTGNGFAMGSISYDAKGRPYIRITQQAGLAVNTETGKPAPEAVAQGSLSIKLNAYREEYTFKDFQIKYSYKKPSMVTKNAQTSIVPAAGKRDSSFYVYNNTEKRYAYYMDRENYNEDYSYDIYSSVTADDKDVTLAPIDNSVLSCRYSYAGDEKSHDFTLTLDSPWWRESLTASHTAKAIDPAAYLDYSTVTLNTSLRSDAYNYVYLAGASRADMAGLFTKFDIEGADEKSKELLAKDYLVMTSSGNVIKAEQNRAEFMNAGGAAIPAGTYSFSVTPYYYDDGSKENKKLNTLAFKVNVINSAVTAKVSPKGSLDLTYGMGSMPYDKKNVCVLAEPEFKNLSSGYGVRSCRLTGEYSEYFSLIRNRNSTIRYGGKWIYSDYIYVNTAGKLKAGQAYRLAIEYTLANADGQEIKVTSNTFTIKPKQTLPKISVSGNNQILYAGANLSRSCTLTVPVEYAIESASGSLDINKDGAPDISATGAGYDNGRYRITLSIADKDAITASSGGTGYSIPITVRLRGRDGISKDAAVTIKVKVKR